MKNKTIMIMLCAFLMGCNIYKKENGIKPINGKIVMKKLENNYLKKIKKENKKIQLIENDSIIELEESSDYYVERRQKNNEALKKVFVYDKNTHLLLSTGTHLNELPIGLHKNYNEKGELIREINFDENFTFSVYDLIAKIKITHKIDLNDEKENISIRRNIDKETGKHIYVIYYDKSDNGSYKYITVDGATGQILSEGNGHSI
jgi:hypothetical protein